MAVARTRSIHKLMYAYDRMFLIRAAEERIAKLYLDEKIMSFVHFYIGQEAVAVGVADALLPTDKMLGNHRSHGHYLAKGGDLTRMIAELLGKSTGSSRGKGGSMHMIDRSVNFVGSTPILGSVVPLATGVAFEQKHRKRKDVTVAFLGDGAFEEGVVYESINMAGLFSLPLVLVVENNLYSVNSPLKDRRAAKHNVSKIVEGFGARYLRADGNDYQDVVKKAEEAVSHARSGKGPVVLECMTYRHMAHSAPIFDESSRGVDVRAHREKKDALRKLRNELKNRGVSERTLTDSERTIVATIETSLKKAQRAPYPDASELTKGLYA